VNVTKVLSRRNEKGASTAGNCRFEKAREKQKDERERGGTFRGQCGKWGGGGQSWLSIKDIGEEYN